MSEVLGSAGSQQTVRVIREYRTAYPEPILVRAGEQVILGRRDDIYPAFFWVTTRSGASGWMAERDLQLSGEIATACSDYEATELSITPGEELTVLDEVGGWLWCLNANEERGWIPATHVRF